MIYEVIENPILQRFLEIDIQYDPYFEYLPIEFKKNTNKVILQEIQTRRRSEDNFNNSSNMKFDLKRASRKNNNRSNSMSKLKQNSLLVINLYFIIDIFKFLKY